MLVRRRQSGAMRAARFAPYVFEVAQAFASVLDLAAEMAGVGAHEVALDRAPVAVVPGFVRAAMGDQRPLVGVEVQRHGFGAVAGDLLAVAGPELPAGFPVFAPLGEQAHRTAAGELVERDLVLPVAARRRRRSGGGPVRSGGSGACGGRSRRSARRTTRWCRGGACWCGTASSAAGGVRRRRRRRSRAGSAAPGRSLAPRRPAGSAGGGSCGRRAAPRRGGGRGAAVRPAASAAGQGGPCGPRASSRWRRRARAAPVRGPGRPVRARRGRPAWAGPGRGPGGRGTIAGVWRHDAPRSAPWAWATAGAVLPSRGRGRSRRGRRRRPAMCRRRSCHPNYGQAVRLSR